ncbi:MAG: DUF1186 domain-containing protein [Armatimonadota bacterium]
MTTQEIIAELTYNSGVFPQHAVTEAIKQREEITPALMHIIENATTNIEDIALQEDYMGHIFAMYLLAQFREKRSYPILVDFVSADQKLVEQALGDVITEDLGRMLASVCGGDVGLICGMVENVKLDKYVRSAALEALVVLVAQEVKTRGEIIAYFQSLFHGKLERNFDFVWSSLVSHCCDLYPGEMAEEIEQAYSDGLVDTTFIGVQDVNWCLEKGKYFALAKLAQDNNKHFIEDTAHDMAGWACFQDSQRFTTTSPTEQTWQTTQWQVKPKVGRNAPCPCGSGKKYKKCCGK